MDGQIVIGTKIDTKSFESQIDALEDKLDTLTKEYSVAMKDADFPEEEILKYRKEIEQTTNKLIKLKKQQDDLGKTGLQNVGKSMSSIISKVTKWGLAVFGVRSAYMFVRQAMSTLSEYDDGMAYKLEYIRWLIATAIKPVIEWIINAVFKLIGIIGGAIKAISGVNIFANSSAKSFEKMKKNANATSKATKEIKKDLYGWDEATRIEESGGLAGIGGVGSTFDMPEVPDIIKETETFAEKIKKWFAIPTKEEWKNIFEGMAYPWKLIYEKTLKEGVDEIKKSFSPLVKWFENNVFNPIVNSAKFLLSPIANWIDENLVSPIKGMFGNIRSVIRPIINGIIDDVNHLLEPLGLKIPRIEDKVKISAQGSEKAVKGALTNTDTKVEETGNNIEENITNNLDEVITKANELNSKEYSININSKKLNPIEQTIKNIKDGLKLLTGKTWQINSKLAVTGAAKGLTQVGSLTVNLPKLAKGGILNNPGRGVPVGGAIAGEKGREFYMPLQDEQMLSMVGEAIGRYVTINLTNINKMNGRVLNRETKRISAENDFATNGGI